MELFDQPQNNQCVTIIVFRALTMEEEGIDTLTSGSEVFTLGANETGNSRRCLPKFLGGAEHAVHESPMPLASIIETRQLLFTDGDQPEPLLPLGMEGHVEAADVQQSPRLISVPVGAVKEEEVTSLQYLDIRSVFSSHDLLLPTRCSSMPVPIELLYQDKRDL